MEVGDILEQIFARGASYAEKAPDQIHILCTCLVRIQSGARIYDRCVGAANFYLSDIG